MEREIHLYCIGRTGYLGEIVYSVSGACQLASGRRPQKLPDPICCTAPTYSGDDDGVLRVERASG
jgi:hypothetical protein